LLLQKVPRRLYLVGVGDNMVVEPRKIKLLEGPSMVEVARVMAIAGAEYTIREAKAVNLDKVRLKEELWDKDVASEITTIELEKYFKAIKAPKNVKHLCPICRNDCKQFAGLVQCPDFEKKEEVERDNNREHEFRTNNWSSSGSCRIVSDY